MGAIKKFFEALANYHAYNQSPAESQKLRKLIISSASGVSLDDAKEYLSSPLIVESVDSKILHHWYMIATELLLDHSNNRDYPVVMVLERKLRDIKKRAAAETEAQFELLDICKRQLLLLKKSLKDSIQNIDSATSADIASLIDSEDQQSSKLRQIVRQYESVNHLRELLEKCDTRSEKSVHQNLISAFTFLSQSHNRELKKLLLPLWMSGNDYSFIAIPVLENEIDRIHLEYNISRDIDLNLVGKGDYRKQNEIRSLWYLWNVVIDFRVNPALTEQEIIRKLEELCEQLIPGNQYLMRLFKSHSQVVAPIKQLIEKLKTIKN